MIADPGDLRALARRVRFMADDVRARRAALAGAQGVGWHSAAAESFRRSLADRAVSVGSYATRLDELADALLAHASAVEAQLARIAAAERYVRDRVVELERGAERAGQGLVDGVVDGVQAVGHWIGGATSDAWSVVRRVATSDLPPAGSPEWLDLAARVR